MSGRQYARTGGVGGSCKPWDIQQAEKSIRVRNAGESLLLWPAQLKRVRSSELNRPQKQTFTCVPHADGFFGLLDVPGFAASAHAPRSCVLTPGHSLVPSAPVAVVRRQHLRTSASRSTPRRPPQRAPYRYGIRAPCSCYVLSSTKRFEILLLSFLKSRNPRFGQRNIGRRDAFLHGHNHAAPIACGKTVQFRADCRGWRQAEGGPSILSRNSSIRAGPHEPTVPCR